MKIAQNVNHKMYLVPEVTYGTPVATPALTQIRHTGTTLGLSVEANKSDEITGTRQLKYMRHGNSQVGGDINCELSYGSFDALIAAAMQCAPGDNLTLGSTRTSFTVYRHFTDITDKPWHMATGCEVNKFSIKCAAGKIVTCSFGIVGSDYTIAAAAPVGATYPAVSVTPPIDTFIGEMSIGGEDFGGAGFDGIITELTLNVENGLTPQFGLFSSKALDVGNGQANVSGEVGLQFSSSTILAAFLARNTTVPISLILNDTLGNAIQFDITAAFPTGGQPDVSGMTGAVNIKMPFTAVVGDGNVSPLLVTFTDAIAV